MAKNTGRGFRRGAVRARSQVRNPLTWIWTKRDDATGRFVDGKTSGGRFKGVRRERSGGQMSLREMSARVAAELLGVPRGPRGSAQNIYRMVYAAFRINSLGRKLEIPCSTAAAHAEALRVIGSHYPGFRPNCV